jgi:hypothetical protein
VEVLLHRQTKCHVLLNLRDLMVEDLLPSNSERAYGSNERSYTMLSLGNIKKAEQHTLHHLDLFCNSPIALFPESEVVSG